MATLQDALNPRKLDGWFALNGMWVHPNTLLIRAPHAEFRLRLRGGKGGFGNMLKQEGERMSKKKKNETSNEFRNLQGQRVLTITQAKAIAKQRAESKKAAQDKADRKRKKIEAALNPKVDIRIERPKFVIGKKVAKQAKHSCDAL